MNLTKEEQLMYSVMNAIYVSDIPMEFKGATVLKACLMREGFEEEIRHTSDIDGNWYSERQPTSQEIADSLQKALEKAEIDLRVSVYRPYGEGRSAGLELADPATEEVLFTMDIDVNRPIQPTTIYQVTGLTFRGVTADQMLADKVSAISTEKVFRRIKDMVDLYYLSQVFEFDRADLMETLENSGRMLGDFKGFLHGTADLRHAYEKFRFTGDVSKPPFDEVYGTVQDYIQDILPREKKRDLER